MVFTPTDPMKAEVRVIGEAPNQSLDFYIPRGPKGDPGGYTAATSLGLSDLNNITVPGLYRQSLSTSATPDRNYPSASSGTLEVFEGQNSADLTQRWTPWGGVSAVGRNMFIRRRDGAGTWSTWVVYMSGRVDQTAGRAVYLWDHLNNRDQLIWGDTGWRTITLDNGFRTTLMLRRFGSTVTIRGAIACPTGTASMNGTFLTTVPTGFGPGTGTWVFYPVRSNVGSTWFTLYRKGNELAFEGSPVVADGNETRIEVSWQTTDTWPTSLPGTGTTIPNT